MNDPAASDLPEETRRRIDAFHERLDRLDHYTILGLARNATRPQIRSAFLAMAPQFHPDRFFGKKLGPYAAKMQRVFAHLSEAHDTLLNQEQRAAYDKTLPPPLPGAATAPQPFVEAARRGSPNAPPSAPPPPSRAPVTAPPPPPAPPAPLSPEASRARQQAFASRLAGQAGRLRSSTPVAPFRPGDGRTDAPRGAPSSPAIQAPDPKAAAEALRRRYEESLAHARGKQTTQALQAADAAVKKGDFVEAARQYRVAYEQNPDPGIRAALAETEAKAKEQTYTTAVERARQAEQRSEFEEAASQWSRAFETTPSADVANRAAMCMRRAGSDSRRAAKYGEEAVKLDPNKAAYRVTLALIYADAGLFLRARGEIDRAKALEPDSPLVKDGLAKLKGMK